MWTITYSISHFRRYFLEKLNDSQEAFKKFYEILRPHKVSEKIQIENKTQRQKLYEKVKNYMNQGYKTANEIA